METVNPRPVRFLGAVLVATGALLSAPVPSAFAVRCPDAEVVFARGTNEPPGVGGIGQDLIDSLRARIVPESVGVYPVNYPASTDFPTALDGIRDAGHHVEHMAATCPSTKMVLGGYSQGAAVMGFVTSPVIPQGAPSDTPQPMPPQVADHVAAVVLFGTPSTRFMNVIDQPPIVIGPAYRAKTVELCAPGDPICSDGRDRAAHAAYSSNGMVDRGAAFAANHL